MTRSIVLYICQFQFPQPSMMGRFKQSQKFAQIQYSIAAVTAPQLMDILSKIIILMKYTSTMSNMSCDASNYLAFFQSLSSHHHAERHRLLLICLTQRFVPTCIRSSVLAITNFNSLQHGIFNDLFIILFILSHVHLDVDGFQQGRG